MRYPLDLYSADDDEAARRERQAGAERVFGKVVLKALPFRVHQEVGDVGPIYVLRVGAHSEDGPVGAYVCQVDHVPTTLDEVRLIYRSEMRRRLRESKK